MKKLLLFAVVLFITFTIKAQVENIEKEAREELKQELKDEMREELKKEREKKKLKEEIKQEVLKDIESNQKNQNVNSTESNISNEPKTPDSQVVSPEKPVSTEKVNTSTEKEDPADNMTAKEKRGGRRLVRLGIKGSFNMGKPSGFSSGDYKGEFVPGFGAGIFLQIPLGFLFIRPEVQYSNENGILTVSDNGKSESIKYKNTVIKVPLLVGFEIGRRIGIYTGYNFAYSAKTEITEGKADLKALTQKEDELTQNSPYSIPFGVHFSGKKGTFKIDMRYNVGISDEFEINKTTFKTNLFEVSLLLGIGI